LDEQLIEAWNFIAARKKKRSVLSVLDLDKATFQRGMAMVEQGSGAFESIALSCTHLRRCSASACLQRFLILKRLNGLVKKIFKFAHTGLTSEPHTLGARLGALRHLILMDVKRELWEKALPAAPNDDGVVKSGPVVSLNRFEAESARAAASDKRGTSHKTLFEQLFAQLHAMPPNVLRRRDRAFKVKFIGEGSDDYGGPFREAITNMCAELQSETSKLFVLTPNGQQGAGNNRSAFTVRPSTSNAPEVLAQFAFLGKLFGCSMLQRECQLDFELSAHVWKRIAGVDLSESDLATFDEATLSSMRQLKRIHEEGIDEDTFGDLFFETFETRLSDGTTIELIEDGRATDVTFASREKFVDLVIGARLAEGAQQCEALFAGLASMVPGARILRLMTGQELELLTCGEADIDLAALRAHTAYGATASATMAHVRYFWQALESFTPDQRRLFLKYIWGRNRLPLTEDDWGDQKMKIHTMDKRRPDQYFPVAHTCFFSIEVPRYSSRDVCYSKLLWAINNCTSIDADNTREALANMNTSSMAAPAVT